MSNRFNLSQRPFSDGDYADGEIRPLEKGTPLWNALQSELWLNCSEETRQEYLNKLASPTYFVGTLVSKTRGQVELTIISLNSTNDGPGAISLLAISLDNVSRFI